jgi:hypothetical protein
MVSEDIATLFLLYIKPVSAIGRILDRGRLWFAIVAALGASFLVHLPQPQFQGLMTPPAAAVPAGQALVERALSQWIAIDPSSYFAPLGALALAFVPLILAIRAVSGFGSFGVLMRSDYLSLLMCSLLAWTAAALEKYVARRPYDAEGLYWLGRTHTSLGHPDRARECFEQCIEAVKTAPGHRRAHIRKWAREAQSALRALK